MRSQAPDPPHPFILFLLTMALIALYFWAK